MSDGSHSTNINYKVTSHVHPCVDSTANFIWNEPLIMYSESDIHNATSDNIFVTKVSSLFHVHVEFDSA